MEKKWETIEVFKSPNTPEYIDKIIDLIIKENPNLSSDLCKSNPNTFFDADICNENNEKLKKALNKLVIGIREFEEALLYIK